MSLDFIIEQAEPQQLQAVLKLLKECDLHTEDVADIFNGNFCIALNDSEIAGCCGMEIHGETALLRSVAVKNEYRENRLAERMVKERTARAGEQGTETVYLLTIDAENYFHRFGFVEVERSEVPSQIKQTYEYSNLCPIDAKVMKLMINNL